MKRYVTLLGTALLTLGAILGIWAAGGRAAQTPAMRAKVKTLRLAEVRVVERGPWSESRTERVVVGGRIWDAAMLLPGRSSFTFDTGGGWDYLEAWIGRRDAGPNSGATLVVFGDGQRLGSYQIAHGDPARFIAVPLHGVRTMKFDLRPDEAQLADHVVVANARLISGVAKPSRPTDIYVSDGQTVFIEQPGDYTVRFRTQ